MCGHHGVDLGIWYVNQVYTPVNFKDKVAPYKKPTKAVVWWGAHLCLPSCIYCFSFHSPDWKRKRGKREKIKGGRRC